MNLTKSVAVLTRAQAVSRIAALSDPESIAKFSEHKNPHVKKYVANKLALLARILEQGKHVDSMNKIEQTVVEVVPVTEVLPVETTATPVETMATPVDVVIAANPEFDELVRHFTELGKKNPQASARASMAARKQAAQRKAKLDC